MAPRFQPCFYGTRRWCRGPALASRDAALRWLARNAHRIVEDVVIESDTGNEYLTARSNPDDYLRLQSAQRAEPHPQRKEGR